MSTLYSRVVNTKRKKNFKVNIERYESPMEVVKHCQERQITDPRFKDERQRERRLDWDGVNSYDEALDYMKNGYQPTVDKLKDAIKASKTGDGKRISFKNDISGFMPIVPLALMGVPNSMINVTMKPIKCKVIDVYYDMACNCGTSPETILKRGQQLLGIIMELERQGYKFNLYAVQTYNEYQDADVLIVKIKSSNTPIDLKKMSFSLTHPAFFRVIGFDWYTKTPHGTWRSGYGHDLKMEFSRDDLKLFAKQVFGDNAVFLRGTNMDSDKEHVKEVLMSNEKIDKDR